MCLFQKRVHDEFSSSEDETDSDFEDPDEIEVPGGGRNLKTLQEHVVAGPSSSGKGAGGGGKAKAKTGGSGDGGEGSGWISRHTVVHRV